VGGGTNLTYDGSIDINYFIKLPENGLAGP